MSTLGTGAVTLADWAKNRSPDGKIAKVVELLAQTNPINDDMLWVEANNTTSHTTTVRTGLDSVSWRLFNSGTTVSKSTEAQIVEGVGMLDAWSECDVALANLGGNPSEFRASRAKAKLQAMNQEVAGTIFYGNAGTAPEEFNGLATRYSALGQNCISGGGSGSDNSSIWLVGWGEETVHGLYPKGSTAGLQHKDYGEVTVETTNGVGGARIRMYQEQFLWHCGLAVKDWRYAVRGCNIDISALTTESSAANLTKLMIKMLHRLPTTTGAMTEYGYVGVKPAFYVNRTVAEMLDIQRYNAYTGVTGANGAGVTEMLIDGKLTMAFRGIPIRVCDQLTEAEATVS